MSWSSPSWIYRLHVLELCNLSASNKNSLQRFNASIIESCFEIVTTNSIQDRTHTKTKKQRRKMDPGTYQIDALMVNRYKVSSSSYALICFLLFNPSWNCFCFLLCELWGLMHFHCFRLLLCICVVWVNCSGMLMLDEEELYERIWIIFLWLNEESRVKSESCRMMMMNPPNSEACEVLYRTKKLC